MRYRYHYYIHVMYLHTYEKVCLGKSPRMSLSDNSKSENCLRGSWNTTLLFKPISLSLFFISLIIIILSSSYIIIYTYLTSPLPPTYRQDSLINQSIMNLKANHTHNYHYSSQKEQEKEEGEKNLFTGPGEQTIFYPPLAPIQTRRNKFFRTRGLQMRSMTLDEWWEGQERRFFAAAECDERFGRG